MNKTERMKVTACLNPLHTALAVYGCVLGYRLIADEMKDPALSGLVWKLGMDEGLPVVESPGILKPEDFLKEVLTERLPNPFLMDTPQRIATDTSQKVGIRFGETIKAYVRRGRRREGIDGGAAGDCRVASVSFGCGTMLDSPLNCRRIRWRNAFICSFPTLLLKS